LIFSALLIVAPKKNEELLYTLLHKETLCAGFAPGTPQQIAQDNVEDRPFFKKWLPVGFNDDFMKWLDNCLV